MYRTVTEVIMSGEIEGRGGDIHSENISRLLLKITFAVSLFTLDEDDG